MKWSFNLVYKERNAVHVKFVLLEKSSKTWSLGSTIKLLALFSWKECVLMVQCHAIVHKDDFITIFFPEKRKHQVSIFRLLKNTRTDIKSLVFSLTYALFSTVCPTKSSSIYFKYTVLTGPAERETLGVEAMDSHSVSACGHHMAKILSVPR